MIAIPDRVRAYEELRLRVSWSAFGVLGGRSARSRRWTSLGECLPIPKCGSRDSWVGELGLKVVPFLLAFLPDGHGRGALLWESVPFGGKPRLGGFFGTYRSPR